MSVPCLSNILVIDIGKTHVKLCLLDDKHHPILSEARTNEINNRTCYPSAKVDELWDWMVIAIQKISAQFEIGSIIFTTHGATCALIDRKNESLVLPILDYEYTQLDQLNDEYLAIKPDYSETYSPALPAGLNIGKQLFWLQKNYPNEFNQATDILMYPQYWAWKLTGQLFSEITSLGCHTDLWSIKENDYSSLVKQQGWRDLFPTMSNAWQDLGTVKADIAELLGVPKNCKVHSGIHDSNSSFLRYRLSQNDSPFTVISTGTWTITMAANVDIENLTASKDMLANIDATGKPIACARFMGGREFGTICKLTNSLVTEKIDIADLQQVIDNNVYALPDFSGGSGPYSGTDGQIVGEINSIKGIALATLYCALMIEVQLEALEAAGEIYIEGAFLKNPLLCAVVAQLRPNQVINLSTDDTGTVLGAAALTNWGQEFVQLKTVSCSPLALRDLQQYKQQWRQLIASR